MATVLPTDLDVIALAIKARLMTSLGWPSERVVIDMRSDVDHDQGGIPQADQYLRLQCRARQPDQASAEGRGRVYPRVDAMLACTIRSRVDLDSAVSDQIALTDPGTEERAARGHLPLEHRVWNALWNFHPEDAAGNWLVMAPIQPRSGAAPLKRPKGWAQSVLEFSVSFLLKLDQSYQ